MRTTFISVYGYSASLIEKGPDCRNERGLLHFRKGAYNYWGVWFSCGDYRVNCGVCVI